jgi:pimeloyl-ACP methyl ester carboxylesterase
MNRPLRIPAAIGLGFWALVAAAGSAEQPALTLSPCQPPGVPGPARCGLLPAYENRVAKKGRQIDLKILVLAATGGNRAPDPLVFLAGGPGESATEAAAGLAMDFAKSRERRDLLLVDQRGTGGSHPLNCSLFEPAGELQSHLGDFLPFNAVRKCRSELEKDADLTLYTTPIAMDDLDQVRAALGYDQLDLYGGSYGTRAALVYLRRHEAHVRTVTIQGVAPTDQLIPLHFPRDTERALNFVLGECAAEAACRAAFPDAKADRLAADPVPAEILHPETGESATVRISRDVAAETIRYMLYSPAAAGQIPAFLHAAAAGDFAPLAEMALFGRQHIVASGSMGDYLSVTCAEDVPWIETGEGEREAAGTMLGDYRLRQQRAACGVWPRGELPLGYRRPVHSKIPVLILSGSWDPVTPPANGAAVAKSLSRSLHVVVPHGGHDLDGLTGVDCIDRLVADFVERGTTTGLDTDCADRIERPPFPTAVPPMKPVPMDESRLAEFAGAYAGEGRPFEARLEVSAGRLRLALPGDRTMLLVPVSADRFRIVGVPFAAVRFEMAEGRVRRAVLEEGGVDQVTLVPKASSPSR